MNDTSRPRVSLPDDLELMAAGPELCALLASVPRAALSDTDRVRLLRARNRLAAHVQGELFADLYAVSLDDDPDEEAMSRHDAPSRYPWATCEVAFALTWTETAAGARLEQARQLAEDLPQVFTALREGRLDMPKVLVICELSSWLDDPQAARRLVDTVLEQAAGWTTGQLRAKLRQLVLAVDPQAARRRCVTALKARRVESFPNPDGTGDLWGRNLPPQDSAAAWERLTAIARAAKAAGDDRTMNQLRADALLDLLVGEGIAVGGPLGRHLAGLPDADGPPEHTLRADHPGCRRPRPGGDPADLDDARPAAAATAPATIATGPAAAPTSDWDPAWPAAPDDRLTADQVTPHPGGPPADSFDDAGHAYDGDDWPPDWPGRWISDSDPAVTAAGAGRDPRPPATPAGRSPATARGPMPAPRRGTVELLLPLSTATGRDDLPAELVGWGPVIADIARHIAAEQRNTQWRYSAYNRLGELEHHGTLATRPPPARRRPTARTAAHVRTRNRTCTAPGCRIPARSCDLDHTRAWTDGGPTTEANLGPACRRHHRLKHESAATLGQLDPGHAFVWTTPRGMQYLTTPEPPLLHRAQLSSRLPTPPDTS